MLLKDFKVSDVMPFIDVEKCYGSNYIRTNQFK